LAGFAVPASSGSVDTSLAGFGIDRRPPAPGARTGKPAAFKYALAVSRRTPVASSIRRSGHPSCPNATTCCRFVSLKTLAIPAGITRSPPAQCLGALPLAGFQVSIIGRFWVSTEGQLGLLPEPKGERRDRGR
jgi:hypothetical protein